MDYEKLHKDTIAKLQQMVNSGKITVEVARGICADFIPESEDERIRKELISHVQYLVDYYNDSMPNYGKWLAWLEKQGEQKLYVNCNAKEMFIKALERVEEQNNKGYKLTDCDKNSWWEDFKVYTTSEQNLANSAKTCKDEQKPAIIIPKFRVGDEIKTTNEAPLTITKITDSGYWSEDLFICSFGNADKWELVEQKPIDEVEHFIPQKGEYYVCIKDYCSAYGKTTNTKGKIYKSSCTGYINDNRGFGLSWTNSCTENYFRPVKEEDWIVCEQNNVIGKPLQYKEFMSKSIQKNIKSLEDKGIVPNFRLWSISDAKDGDVLANTHGAIFINAGGNGGGTMDCYCYLSVQNEFCIEEHKTGSWLYKADIKPATKEQRDLLFQKMKEAGYEWDAEKKELKKIEQEKDMNNKLTYFEYSLKHIMEEAIECGDTHNLKADADMFLRLVQKHVWSEEDEEHIDSLLKRLEGLCRNEFERTRFAISEDVDWLKSLKDRYTWKPSNEQVNALWDSIKHNLHLHPVLKSLYQDLKKLKEE